MSTPIQQLPAKPAHDQMPPSEDPEVLSMLDEMEKEVSDAQQANALRTPPPSVPMQQMMAPPPMHVPMKRVATKKPLWDVERAQKAVLYGAIAMVIFYPGTMNLVYSKVPKFETILKPYDFILRTVLVAVAIYAAITFLPM